MFRENNLDTSRVIASEGVLRHPDGSIDFNAYRERARRARRAAIRSSVTRVWSLIAAVFAGKPAPTAGHQAT